MEKKEEKKSFNMLKLNKSSIIELNDSDMAVVSAGTEDEGGFLSIGVQCSCDNSCDRDNVPRYCCCYNVA